MTRPLMVRADTIDLQDTDSPHAANHSKPVNGNGIAPHQAAEYQHVAEERQTEEQAWNMAASNGTTTSARSSSEENGTQAQNGDTASGEESEGEGDDDMIDRISSSPSIDEGKHTIGASILCTPPARYRSDEANFNISLRGRLQHALPPRKDSLEHYLQRIKRQRQDSAIAATVETPTRAPSKLSPMLATASLADILSLSHDRSPGSGRYSGDITGSDRIDDTGSDDVLDSTNKIGIDDFAQALQTVHDMYDDLLTSTPTRISRNAFRLMELADHSIMPHSLLISCSPTHSSTIAHTQASLESLDRTILQNYLLPENDPYLEDDASSITPRDSWDSNMSLDSCSPLCELPMNDHGFDFAFAFNPAPACPVIDKSDYLREIEEIDFDFVYALHTFTATVEGQANASKGDTMVLLDDSNSYWWLVRVVKDSSIGYLPAEHIETPPERLARLNKHRNIDLAQTMLGDNPEKSRNPLKLAMRRRTGKTVQFAAPIYFEASDYEYSDDEDQPAGETVAPGTQTTDDPAVNGQPIEVEERNAPEEANVHATRRYSGDQTSIASKSSMDSTHKASFEGGIGEDPQLSPKLVDRSEAAPLKSRKGTPRNTDSFLKDDTETRKITLTPGLLREDNTHASPKSSSIESQRNTSLESLTKVPSPSDTASNASSKKDSKDKKKDKNKGGMLSGLFKSKKKDKKGGRDDDGFGDEKTSSEFARGANQYTTAGAGDRASSISAVGRDNHIQSRGVAGRPISAPIAQHSMKQEIKVYPMAELQGSEAKFPTKASGTETGKTPKAKRSKERMQLDDFDSPGDHSGPNPFDEQARRAAADELGPMSPSGTITGGGDFVHIPTAFGSDDESDEEDDDERNDDDEDDEDREVAELEDSSIAQDAPASDVKSGGESQREGEEEEKEVFTDARENTTSPLTVPEHQTIQPPALQAASQPPQQDSISSSPTSSVAEAETPKSATPTTFDSGKHTWDDGALRAWLDAEEVKDMLTIVHASARLNGAVEPVSDDHPLMRGLYTEERGAVERMMGELDSLMLGWAGRKGLVQ